MYYLAPMVSICCINDADVESSLLSAIYARQEQEAYPSIFGVNLLFCQFAPCMWLCQFI